MQNKVELELVNERQEQFLELEKGLYSYFYVLCLPLMGSFGHVGWTDQIKVIDCHVFFTKQSCQEKV